MRTNICTHSRNDKIVKTISPERWIRSDIFVTSPARCASPPIKGITDPTVLPTNTSHKIIDGASPSAHWYNYSPIRCGRFTSKPIGDWGSIDSDSRERMSTMQCNYSRSRPIFQLDQQMDQLETDTHSYNS